MKFNLWFIFLGVILSITNLFSQNTYFIKYKENLPQREINEKVLQKSLAVDDISLQIDKEIISLNYLAKGMVKNIESLSKIVKVTFDEKVGEERILELKNSDPSIEYIQMSTTYQLDFVPNDSLLSEQWALNKIQAFDAWDKTQGADSILLAIIDTGLDYLHSDLQNKIYLNPGEIGTDNNNNDKRSNGIDDDNNGFVDDYRGWDFTDRVGFPFDSTGGDYLDWDNDPKDEQGHGTFIGGIAAAEVNNVTGIAGVAPNIKILNLRAFDPSGFGEEDDVAAAIIYAVQLGAKVINMSFGDNAFSLVLRDVIRFAYAQGVVLVGSSGNSGSTDPHYPSGYSEVISVGNSTVDDFVSSNSNYGSTLDLVAPGSSILTTARNNNYASIGGTSASTPHVAAAAALILSLQNFTNEEVKQIIKSTTDDIGEPGWDLRSGAGRLNLFKAVTVVAPSVIKINHPTQDFATLDNKIVINASVLSSTFQSYSLYHGTGYNPNSWNNLINNGTNQFSNEDIYTLDISSFSDSVYTIRLEVTLSNGRTLEERVNYLVTRTPPLAELISVGPSYYGDKTTILAAMYTDEPSLVRMYYRQVSAPEFNFVTLDGFTTNNQFVKQFHYGFIPRQIVEQNSAYEVYFEAENLVGLTSMVDDDGSNFLFSTRYEADYAGEIELPFSLPPGTIFENPVNLTGSELKEIYLRENTSSNISSLFKLNNESFEKIDSLEDRIVRDFGDFNNNGLKDVLSFFIRDGFIYEQTSAGSSSLTQEFSQETGDFWPVMADDIDRDNVTEIIVVDTDTSMKVWKVNNNLSLTASGDLPNYTPGSFGGNIIDSPNGVIADINSDGRDELWTVDLDGDIYSYEIFGQNDYRQGSVFTTKFIGSAAYITAGDYDSDNIDELAVLLRSIEEVDIAPFYRLIVFNLVGDSLNILYDQALIDAATEFSSAFQRSENSVRFADLDNDTIDELIVFMFPYSYVFKNFAGINKVISYKENINSNSIFVGDINFNGVTEVAFPTSEAIKFYEFEISTITSTPYNITGYSVDSTRIHLKWSGNVDQYFIYRGTDPVNLVLIDSSFTNEFTDQQLNTNTFYYYGIKAFDFINPTPLSNLSLVIEVYSHNPGQVQNVIATSSTTVLVNFTEKMNNTIENLQAFNLQNVGIPNSVAPANQYAYLLTFGEALPEGENQITIQNLKDLYGSPIPATIDTFMVDPGIEMQEFFVSSFNVENPYLIKVVFNFDINETSAVNTSNYIFEPDNRASSVKVDQTNKNIIYINLQGQKPVGSIGREYVLQIKDVHSSMETGNIIINSGAGSFLVLTGFANDLSDVYVYPNPAEIRTGESVITFANLPQFASITIWNLDGMKVAEVEETDGNGGAQYNLKDLSGDYLSSGVYIYRVTMLDELNNEKDEKIGKFAVVR
jgi:hypothetical protein